MRIDIHANSFPLTDAIEQHVMSHVLSALKPVKRRVKRVLVRLEDINGNHGGVDKVCRIIVLLQSAKHVVVETIDADLYSAISRSAGRVRRAALRVTKRPVRRERSDPQRPGVFGGLKLNSA